MQLNYAWRYIQFVGNNTFFIGLETEINLRVLGIMIPGELFLERIHKSFCFFHGQVLESIWPLKRGPGVLFNRFLLSLYIKFKSGLREYVKRSYSSSQDLGNLYRGTYLSRVPVLPLHHQYSCYIFIIWVLVDNSYK